MPWVVALDGAAGGPMNTYEQLAGAQGRSIFYRAERYRARDIFKRAAPELALNGITHTLDDISLNGVGASAGMPGSNEICTVGDHVSVALALQGIPLFNAAGRVARVHPTPHGTRIGVRLTDRCFNAPDVIAKYEEILVRSSLDENYDQHQHVSEEYRRLCADVLYLLRSHRASLDRFAKTRPNATASSAMLAACEERILPRWRALWHSANAMVMPIMGDDVARRATKDFTESVLTPEFMPGAIWRRSYEKPLGYPGDFEIMAMVYDWRRDGERLFDQLVHRLGLDVAECIATRMVIMRQAIAATAPAQPGAPARIASLGCGPAREVVDYLQLRDLPRPVHFTLIDQDQRALSHVYESTYPAVMRLRGKANVSCLNTSFSQLIRAGDLFGKLPEQDLIYSVGLIDYLSARRAKALTEALYAQLAPGGTLIVGNMLETTIGNLWPMEFLCDWSIVYRSEADMRQLAAGLPEAAMETSFDPTGRVVLLKLGKPAA